MRLYLAYFNLVACDLVPFDSNFERECKLFTQHVVLDDDCCISWNVGRTKINLVTSNKLYFFVYNLSYDVNIDLQIPRDSSYLVRVSAWDLIPRYSKLTWAHSM